MTEPPTIGYGRHAQTPAALLHETRAEGCTRAVACAYGMGAYARGFRPALNQRLFF